MEKNIKGRIKEKDQQVPDQGMRTTRVTFTKIQESWRESSHGDGSEKCKYYLAYIKSETSIY